MALYDVFLSHATADKADVERLARKLRMAGLEPFLDQWHLVPGEPWQEALEEALDQSRTCAVFLGKGLGPWQNEEMRSALESGVRDGAFRVIPVLLPGGREPGKEGLPRFLRRRTWVDFRAGIENEDAFDRLLAGIRGKAPGAGEERGTAPSLPYRCMAPPREPFIQRGEYGRVRDALLAGTTVGITTAIHGAGGFGKTALAIEICYDKQIREKYPDGVLWTTLGEEIDDAGRLARVRDLIRWWIEENPPAFETVSAASAHLRKELDGKRVLLVIDDVWNPGDILPFQILAPEAALLITTRDSRTLPSGSAPIHVDAMEVPEAVQLLRAGLRDERDVDLRGLATRLGEWPLLLKIVNRQLRELVQDDSLSLEQSLREVNEALDAEGLTAFDRDDLESRGLAVAQTVGASLRRLSAEDVERFEQLAIFPEDKDIPFQVLEKLWRLSTFATKKHCGRLHDLSLLLRFDRLAGTIRLHDVIRSYLLKKGESRLPEWNQRLLDAYRPVSGLWPDLPREESYLWSHLLHHLMGAGQREVGRELLLDFRFLAAKLTATDINALIADYSSFVDQNQEIRLVRDSLRLSAHVLALDPPQLREQLWGRLLDRQELEIQGLLQSSECSGTPWLRPRKASLTRPGGPLIRTIDHPGVPQALAVLPDGRVVSGSDDGMLRVWDVENCQVLEAFEAHSRPINTVAVLGSHQVVSGSYDGTLRIWDVLSGKSFAITTEGVARALATLDGRRVASSTIEGKLRIWDVESGEALGIFDGGGAAIAALDSQRVITGSMHWAKLLVRDVESGQSFGIPSEFPDVHSGWVWAIAKLDSRRVVAGTSKGTLWVWDVESGQTLQVLEGHSAKVKALIALDSHRVVSGSDDGMLRVWDIENGQSLQILEGHSGAIHAVAMLDNHRVISGSEDKTLRVWDVENRPLLHVNEKHSDEVRTVAVLSDNRVVSASNDKTLMVWDVESGRPIHILEGHSNKVHAVAVLDKHRIVSGSWDRTLRVWDLQSAKTLQILEGHSDHVRAVAVLDSRRVISDSPDGTLRVWNVQNGQALQILHGHTLVGVLDGCRVVSFSDSSGRALQMWDVESGKTLQVFEGYPDREGALAVAENSLVVVSSNRSWSNTLQVWNVQSGKILQILRGHSERVGAVAVLDGRRVVSGSCSERSRAWGLRLWEVESGQTLQVLEGYSKRLRAATIGEPSWGRLAMAVLESRWVVSGSDDGTLRIWDVEAGEVKCVFTLDSPVTAIAVIPDRRIIVAGDTSGRVHFFDFVES